jgi:hypothetical protein
MNNNAEKETDRLIAKIQRASLRARLQQRNPKRRFEAILSGDQEAGTASKS